jgi:hypothetical protein
MNSLPEIVPSLLPKVSTSSFGDVALHARVQAIENEFSQLRDQDVGDAPPVYEEE